jgi:hypothetical protein
MRKTFAFGRIHLVALLTVCTAAGGCDAAEHPLAPYEGARPLLIERLTQSFAPDVQWVGGRVAAVGINRGSRAALDSTLVWLRTTSGDDLGSPIMVRAENDEDAVMMHGGMATDSLGSGETYTFWLATRSVYDAGLQQSALNEHSFADTTLTPGYVLAGRSGGGVEVDFTIYRDERLLSDDFVVSWTPASQPFRQMAIRQATLGGYTDLLWHVVLSDEQDDTIAPPLVIGEAPEGAVVAVPWSDFAEGNHVLWASTSAWSGDSFGFRTNGYAFYQLFASNFE